MGLYDTLSFEKFCKRCEADTPWSCQFKWAGNCLDGYKIKGRLKSNTLGKRPTFEARGLSWCTICKKRRTMCYEEALKMVNEKDMGKKIEETDRLLDGFFCARVNYHASTVCIEKGRIKEIKVSKRG